MIKSEKFKNLPLKIQLLIGGAFFMIFLVWLIVMRINGSRATNHFFHNSISSVVVSNNYGGRDSRAETKTRIGSYIPGVNFYVLFGTTPPTYLIPKR